MTDLLARLRDDRYFSLHVLRGEAADEIDRLRKNNDWKGKAIVDQREQIERLTAEIRQCHEVMQRFVDKCDAGQARSKHTYAEFKRLLTASDRRECGLKHLNPDKGLYNEQTDPAANRQEPCAHCVGLHAAVKNCDCHCPKCGRLLPQPITPSVVDDQEKP